VRQLALVVVLCGALALTGGAHETPQQQVFRSGASLVAVNVTVSDGETLVRGLRQEHFAVYEDGVRQQIQFFQSSDVPLDLVLLVDTSSSMRDVMDVVHSAATGFMNSLRDTDRGAVVTFGGTVQIAQSLTSDKGELEQAIRDTRAYGNTALHNALYIALREFAGKGRDDGDVRRQVFAVLTDGVDTASSLTFDDVMEEVRRSGVMVYTINLKAEPIPVAHLQRAFEESSFGLRRLARESGGQAFTADHVDRLRDIYAGISEELSSQYSIGYVSSNAEADGSFRRLLVQVIGGGTNLKARTRTGYIAQERGLASAMSSNR
jgi:Ca-activated chloride channel homolog